MNSTTQNTRPTSPSRSSSVTTFHSPTASTSTSSLTLVETPVFSHPPRTGTDSSTESNSTVSQRQQSTTRPSQAALLRAREADRAQRAREAKMSTRQADLLRYKGTYTDSGRHSDDWLFGGWSFKDSVKGAWKYVRKDNKGNE